MSLLERRRHLPDMLEGEDGRFLLVKSLEGSPAIFIVVLHEAELQGECIGDPVGADEARAEAPFIEVRTCVEADAISLCVACRDDPVLGMAEDLLEELETGVREGSPNPLPQALGFMIPVHVDLREFVEVPDPPVFAPPRNLIVDRCECFHLRPTIHEVFDGSSCRVDSSRYASQLFGNVRARERLCFPGDFLLSYCKSLIILPEERFESGGPHGARSVPECSKRSRMHPTGWR